MKRKAWTRRRRGAPGYVFAALEEIARRADGAELSRLEDQIGSTFDSELSSKIDAELVRVEARRAGLK